MNFIKNKRGFNLVELLIGMSIGMFLLAGLLTFFGQNRQAYSYQQSQSGQQGSERLASIMFTNVLQQAGFSADPAEASSKLNRGKHLAKDVSGIAPRFRGHYWHRYRGRSICPTN